MKLTTATMLEGVAEALRDQVAPALPPGFASENVRMATALIQIAARTGDDAVANRVEENRKIRGLLGPGAELVADAQLAESLAAASRLVDPGLRISQLDEEAGRLRRLLVALHASLETLAGAAAQALHRAIWQALADFETARAPRA